MPKVTKDQFLTFFGQFHLTTNIVILMILDLRAEFTLEIKCIPTFFVYINTVSVMCSKGVNYIDLFCRTKIYGQLFAPTSSSCRQLQQMLRAKKGFYAVLPILGFFVCTVVTLVIFGSIYIYISNTI